MASGSEKPKPLLCYYGVDWLAHFPAPIGTGKGCRFCDAGCQQLELWAKA